MTICGLPEGWKMAALRTAPVATSYDSKPRTVCPGPSVLSAVEPDEE